MPYKPCPSCKMPNGPRALACKGCGRSFQKPNRYQQIKIVKDKRKEEFKGYNEKELLDKDHPDFEWVVLSSVAMALRYAELEYSDIYELVRSYSSRYEIPDDAITLILEKKVGDIWKSKLKSLKTSNQSVREST